MAESLLMKKEKPTKKKTKKRKMKLNPQIFSGFMMCVSLCLFMVSFAFEQPGSTVILAAALLAAGAFILFSITKQFLRMEFLSNDFLVALCGVFLFLTKGYYEAVWVFLIWDACQMLSNYTFACQSDILKIQKEIAGKKYHVIAGGEPRVTKPADIRPGDHIELYLGEIVPVDGVVAAGAASLNTFAVNGESKTAQKQTKDFVPAGCSVISGNMIIEAVSSLKTNSLSQTAEGFVKAAEEAAPLEKNIKKWLRLLVAVGLVACLVFLFVKFGTSKDINYLLKGIPFAFLLCATDFLGNILPEAYLNAIYCGAKKGIVIKNKFFVENMVLVKKMLLRKRGVLTYDRPVIGEICPTHGLTKKELIRFAALAQYKADSPYSKLLLQEYGEKIRTYDILEFKKLEGDAAAAKLSNGLEVIAGGAAALRAHNIVVGMDQDDAVMCIALNGTFVGAIRFEYQMKEDVKACIDSLRFGGIREVRLISKDSGKAVETMAHAAGIEEFASVASDAEIQDCLGKMGKGTLYVGYGKNKGGIQTSHNGLFYGGYQANAGNPDAFLLMDSMNGVLNFFQIMKQTRRLVLQNLVVDVLLKLVILFMFLNVFSHLWLGVLLLALIQVVQKLNCYRVFKLN